MTSRKLLRILRNRGSLRAIVFFLFIVILKEMRVFKCWGCWDLWKRRKSVIGQNSAEKAREVDGKQVSDKRIVA